MGQLLLRPFRGEQRRHHFPFHRGCFFDLATILELLEHVGHDALAFFDVLHFSATELNFQEHLVVVSEKVPGLIDTGVNVVLARFRANPQFLELLLVSFLCLFFGLGVFEFAVVHNFAYGRAFLGRDLDEIQSSFSGHFQGLECRYNTVLFAFRADEADRANTNLFIHPGAGRSARRAATIVRGDTQSPSVCGLQYVDFSMWTSVCGRDRYFENFWRGLKPIKPIANKNIYL